MFEITHETTGEVIGAGDNAAAAILAAKAAGKSLSGALIERAVVACNTRRGEPELLHVDFSGARLVDVSFSEGVLHDCKFGGADLSRCRFDGASLRHCSFDGASLANVMFTGATLHGVGMPKASLSNTSFGAAWLSCCNFNGASLERCVFSDARVRDSSFDDVRMTYGVYHNAVWRVATFINAVVGGEHDNSLFYLCSFDGADLGGAFTPAATMLACVGKPKACRATSRASLSLVLAAEAGEDVVKLAVAAYVAYSRNDCWNSFVESALRARIFGDRTLEVVRWAVETAMSALPDGILGRTRVAYIAEALETHTDEAGVLAAMSRLN